jgi:hypothetical protein
MTVAARKRYKPTFFLSSPTAHKARQRLNQLMCFKLLQQGAKLRVLGYKVTGCQA